MTYSRDVLDILFAEGSDIEILTTHCLVFDRVFHSDKNFDYDHLTLCSLVLLA